MFFINQMGEYSSPLLKNSFYLFVIKQAKISLVGAFLLPKSPINRPLLAKRQ
jgi:hypothetical protein